MKVEHFAMLAIFLVIGGSALWLNKAADALKGVPIKDVEIKCVICDEDNKNNRFNRARVVMVKAADAEAKGFLAYKEAEEHLREQMNSWLTILGFFGVLFGLIVPLASYMLQRHSLAEERSRVISECENKIKEIEGRVKAIVGSADSKRNGASKSDEEGEGKRNEAVEAAGVDAETIVKGAPAETKEEEK